MLTDRTAAIFQPPAASATFDKTISTGVSSLWLIGQLRFLRRNCARTIALLLASVVCFGATGLGHTGWDDPSCDPIPVHHDHNAHRFQSGRLPANPADDHCLACHSLRSLRTVLIAVHAAVTDDANVATVCAADAVLPGRVLDSTSPSRAPPADLL